MSEPILEQDSLKRIRGQKPQTLRLSILEVEDEGLIVGVQGPLRIREDGNASHESGARGPRLLCKEAIALELRHERGVLIKAFDHCKQVQSPDKAVRREQIPPKSERLWPATSCNPESDFASLWQSRRAGVVEESGGSRAKRGKWLVSVWDHGGYSGEPTGHVKLA